MGRMEQKATSLEELIGKINDDEECDPSYLIETAMKLDQELEEVLSRKTLSGVPNWFKSSDDKRRFAAEEIRQQILDFGVRTREKVSGSIKTLSVWKKYNRGSFLSVRGI